MNIKNPKITKWVKRISGTLIAVMLAISNGGQAYARILFEDDQYFNIQSEGIILDQNDNLVDGTLSTGTYTMADAACVAGETFTATINGTAVTYTATTTDCAGADAADTAAVLQGLTAAIDGDYTVGHIVDATYSANTITITATVADPANNYTTTASDTSTASTLTATGANLTGGVLGDTVDLQFGNDGTDALISYDPNNQNLTFSAPGGMFDFTDDSLRTSGVVQFQGASEFHIREVANETTAACTTVGEIVLDTGENRIYVCTATGSPGTWTASDSGSSQDFDDVYDISQSNANLTMEIDNGSLNFNITTADSFTIQDGGNNIAEFTGAGAILFDPTSGQNFDVTTLGVGDIVFTSADDIDFNSATFNLDTTGIFSLDGVGASNVTTDSGNLTLSTTTSGDVDITGATNVDIASTAGDITLTSGDDIIFDDAQLTGIVQLTDTATDWNVLFPYDGIIDNINAFTSTANGEGASLVGIEDVGTYFTATNVEGALQELGADIGKNYEDLTFYPEYPDTVIDADGTNNRGTLESFYDAVAEMGYYNWTTTNGLTQDIDIHFAFPLPTDFLATGDFTFEYRTGTVTEADNDVEIRLYNVTDATECANDLTNGTAGTWATGTITAASINAGCTGGSALNAGDIVEVRIKLYDNVGVADYSDVGVLIWNYTK